MQTTTSVLDPEAVESSYEDEEYTEANESSFEDDEYSYCDDDLSHDDPYQNRYNDAKGLKKLYPNEAMKTFQSLIDDMKLPILLKFKSLKQMTKLKLQERDYSGAFELYKRLLEYASTNTSSKLHDNDYASNSIEKMLNRIFASHDSGKELFISFARQIYNETFHAFNTIRQRMPCKPNERLWIKVTTQYSHLL